jgi:hypothetical protein
MASPQDFAFPHIQGPRVLYAGLESNAPASQAVQLRNATHAHAGAAFPLKRAVTVPLEGPSAPLILASMAGENL